MFAAIDWVVQHRTDNGMNIRVLNLSFGTDSSQPYSVDPLAYAAEQAWRNGIMVVAAAGNPGERQQAGRHGRPRLRPRGARGGRLAEQRLGDRQRHRRPVLDGGGGQPPARPDRPRQPHPEPPRPGSHIDQTYGATGGITPRSFRGSRTSQATAAASGAAALLFSKYPNATPDQVKSLLMQTTAHIPGSNSASGDGVLNLNDAFVTQLPYASGLSLSSTGLGTIEAARGSNHVSMNGVTLSGEQDIFGKGLSSAALANAEAAIGGLLSGGPWNGRVWNGRSWSGSSWSDRSWSGSSWSGSCWSDSSWLAAGWS